jgi:hypothetical protein
MCIEFVEVDAKSAENTDSACTFGFALTDILQVGLVCGECSVEIGRRWKILVFGVRFHQGQRVFDLENGELGSQNPGVAGIGGVSPKI